VLHMRLVDAEGQPAHGTSLAPGGVPFHLSLILDSDGTAVTDDSPLFEFTGNTDGGVQLAREDSVTFEFKLRYLSSRIGLQTMLRFRIAPVDADVAAAHPQLVFCTPPFKSLARRNGSRHSKGGSGALKRQRTSDSPSMGPQDDPHGGMPPRRPSSPSSDEDTYLQPSSSSNSMSGGSTEGSLAGSLPRSEAPVAAHLAAAGLSSPALTSARLGSLDPAALASAHLEALNAAAPLAAARLAAAAAMEQRLYTSAPYKAPLAWL